MAMTIIATLAGILIGTFVALTVADRGLGPAYLLARVPLQLLLIWWAYWFAVREARRVL